MFESALRRMLYRLHIVVVVIFLFLLMAGSCFTFSRMYTLGFFIFIVCFLLFRSRTATTAIHHRATALRSHRHRGSNDPATVRGYRGRDVSANFFSFSRFAFFFLFPSRSAGPPHRRRARVAGAPRRRTPPGHATASRGRGCVHLQRRRLGASKLGFFNPSPLCELGRVNPTRPSRQTLTKCDWNKNEVNWIEIGGK